MSGQETDAQGTPKLEISTLGMKPASECDPSAYHQLSTVPSNVTATNLRCSDIQASGICGFLDMRAVSRELVKAIEQAQRRDEQTTCAGECAEFQLARFDKTQRFSGSDAVFLDRNAKVVPEGSSAAVSKIDFDWAFDLRFSGEVGLCLSSSAMLKRGQSEAGGQ